MSAVFQGWTREVVADVVRRYRAGEAPRDIGVSYGLSRNAVNSKLDRVGALRRRIPAAPPIVRGKTLKAPAVKRAAPPRMPVVRSPIYQGDPQTSPLQKSLDATRANAEAREAYVEPPARRAAASKPRPWLQRGPNQCNWPVAGVGAEVQSCCAPVFERGWCREHFLAGTQPASVRARVDDRLDIPRARRRA